MMDENKFDEKKLDPQKKALSLAHMAAAMVVPGEAFAIVIMSPQRDNHSRMDTYVVHNVNDESIGFLAENIVDAIMQDPGEKYLLPRSPTIGRA